LSYADNSVTRMRRSSCIVAWPGATFRAIESAHPVVHLDRSLGQGTPKTVRETVELRIGQR